MRFRVPNTQKIYEFWGPRLGRRATGFYATYVWAKFAMAPIGLALFVTVAIAARTHNAAAQGLATAVIVISGVTIALMFLTPVLARRAASQTLGVKINRRNHPPRDSWNYEKWCVTNGLQPYRADG
jgi:heme exporter protein D